MLNSQETTTIDRILQSVAEGLKYIQDHPELSAHQASAAGGAPLTALRPRFRITAEVVEGLRLRLHDVDEQGFIGEVAVPVQVADNVEDAKAAIELYLERYPTLRSLFEVPPFRPGELSVLGRLGELNITNVPSPSETVFAPNSGAVLSSESGDAGKMVGGKGSK